MSKKYLGKSEFRYNYGIAKRPDNNGHVAYITARHKNKYKMNVITHSSVFFNETTEELKGGNPNFESKDKRISRLSVPQWDNVNNFGEKLPNWRFNKENKKIVKRLNRKHSK